MNELIKSDYILNARLEKTFMDVFWELKAINPKSHSGISLEEFTQYPEEWFHNRKVFNSLRLCFESILLDSDQTLQRKFRACLALIFLHDGNINFSGYQKLSATEENSCAISCARLVYNAENFKDAFQAAEKLIQSE